MSEGEWVQEHKKALEIVFVQSISITHTHIYISLVFRIYCQHSFGLVWNIHFRQFKIYRFYFFFVSLSSVSLSLFVYPHVWSAFCAVRLGIPQQENIYFETQWVYGVWVCEKLKNKYVWNRKKESQTANTCTTNENTQLIKVRTDICINRHRLSSATNTCDCHTP